LILLIGILVYFSQARSIQELGRKKFEKLRIGFERSQTEQKSEQKAGSNYLVKKQPKKPLLRATHEPVGSDFASGATLATIADIQPTSHTTQGVRCERPGNIDGILEANAFWIDANQEKAEDVLSGISVMRSCYYLYIPLDLSSLFLNIHVKEDSYVKNVVNNFDSVALFFQGKAFTLSGEGSQ